MPRTSSPRGGPNLLIVALATVVALGLAGCGTSGGGASAAKATTTSSKGAKGTGGASGAGGRADGTTTTRATSSTIDPNQVDTEADGGGQGDSDLPPAVDTDGGGADGGGAGGDGGGTDAGGGAAAPDAGGTDADGAGGGTTGGPYPDKIINGIPLDMSQPFDVGREWALAANYGDFATIDALSCANDARAVAAGQQHQASLAALRQLVAVRWRARDATSGWLEYSYQQVQAQIRTTIETPMILEADGWKVCVYPQY
ncbi:hypothetical protein BH10ACT1_BH10ACT1_19290 [soil metagenome]